MFYFCSVMMVMTIKKKSQDMLLIASPVPRIVRRRHDETFHHHRFDFFSFHTHSNTQITQLERERVEIFNIFKNFEN